LLFQVTDSEEKKAWLDAIQKAMKEWQEHERQHEEQEEVCDSVACRFNFNSSFTH
jgi:hypothetical protein